VHLLLSRPSCPTSEVILSDTLIRKGSIALDRAGFSPLHRLHRAGGTCAATGGEAAPGRSATGVPAAASGAWVEAGEGLQVKTVNFGRNKGPGSSNWRAQVA